ncbi:nucleotide-diphospho-sugar transferase [Pilobolus umbonatus]|nr:nucleotide-diphospho-sugar transferase [Pilobolus umbonatus]
MERPLIVYPHTRFKAAFITFVKTDHRSLSKLKMTMRDIEDQFNRPFQYPYIIFSDQEFSDDFRELVSAMTSASVVLQTVGPDLYGYPFHTDRHRAAQSRMRLNSTMFGDSEDYRFQSRFMAGTIFRHPILQQIDYVWRFEPGAEYTCPMKDDLFQFMLDNHKITSFSMALYEYEETVTTLYDTVISFTRQYPQWIQPSTNSLWNFILDNETHSFNYCHFWNNFQVRLPISPSTEVISTSLSLITLINPMVYSMSDGVILSFNH